MAELANYILKNQGFYSGKYYRSGNTSTPPSARYLGLPYQTAGSNWKTNGYRKIAIDLVSKADEPFSEHFARNQWSDIGANQGAFYHETWVANANARWPGITAVDAPYLLELNFQAAAGTSMLSLYNAFKTLQDDAKATFIKKN